GGRPRAAVRGPDGRRRRGRVGARPRRGRGPQPPAPGLRGPVPRGPRRRRARGVRSGLRGRGQRFPGRLRGGAHRRQRPPGHPPPEPEAVRRRAVVAHADRGVPQPRPAGGPVRAGPDRRAGAARHARADGRGPAGRRRAPAGAVPPGAAPDGHGVVGGAAGPIGLATYPLVEGVPGGRRIFAVVFFVVLVSVLVQGTSIPLVARRLRVDAPLERRPAYPVEATDTLEGSMELHELAVPAGSAAVGRRLVDLQLPPGALVVLISRGDEFTVPQGSTALEAGDTVLLLADRSTLPAARAVIEGRDGEG